MGKIALVILVVILVIAAFYIHRPIVSTGSTLVIGAQQVNVEVADEPSEQVQGLSGRYRLEPNAGMLFVFGALSQPSFWMKDMKFGLDFIWIANGRVEEIMSDIPAEPGVSEDQLKQYKPARSVDSMLEVNAGWAASKGIKTGDEVRLLHP